MYFGSDNIVGASQPVLQALIDANNGAEASYGADSIKKRLDQAFCELFERDVDVFLVATGTAANALSVAAITPPWGMCLSNEESHINGEECGAPEFYSGGAKLVGLPGVNGKLTVKTLENYINSLSSGSYQMPARSVSISQLNECGLVYQPDEIGQIGEICRKYGLYLHMDGARFANALVSLNKSPAELTWKQGVDILSFGATKNGALGVEAVIVFRKELAQHMEYNRKRSGQTLSKGRFLSAQMEAYLKNDHWLDNARQANAMAKELEKALLEIPGIRMPWSVDGNEIFPVMPDFICDTLDKAGAVFYDWPTRSVPCEQKPQKNERLIRLVTSFQTRSADVALFLKTARNAL